MPFEPASEVLSRFTVLDLTRVRSGPTCVRQLADWGANVIKIEKPPEGNSEALGGPRDGPDFQNLHRNKRSMTLNLKSERGLEIFKELVKRADIVVENYRPAVKDRLGIGYDVLQEINPGIVLASISGFGQDGPYKDRPGFDQIAQGMGGLMSVTGEPGRGPMRVGIPVADLCAGLFCAQGILLALLERERSGKGQWIKTSLLQAQIFMLDFQAARWLVDGLVPGQAGNNHPTSIPTGVFETSDGHINIASAGGEMWERLKRVLNESALDDPDFADGAGRSKNRERVNRLINEHTRKMTSAEWIERLNEAGIPCGEINSIDKVFSSPQVEHLKIAQEIVSQERGPTRLVGQPLTLSRTDSSIRVPPPLLGQHTGEILEWLGYDKDTATEMKRAGDI